MARPKTFTEDELMEILAKIEKQYRYLSIETMQKAHDENPFEFPSYKMFERRLGGMRKINTPDFREKLQPFLDKVENEEENEQETPDPMPEIIPGSK